MEESKSGMSRQQEQLDKRSSPAELRSHDGTTRFVGETSNSGGDQSQTKSVSLAAEDADIMPTVPTVTVIPPKKNKIGVADKVESTMDEDSGTGADLTSAAKKIVFVRIVIMKLGEIDTVKETFAADIFIQARWREPKLDGAENAAKRNGKSASPDEYFDPKIVVDNTVGDPKESVSTTVDYPNKYIHEAYIVERRRIKGTFLENFELFQFPFDTQDLTVTLISELSDTEVFLEEDPVNLSTINTEMFVDEQEWRLYNEVQILKDKVVKFYALDKDEHGSHSSLSCRTHASRRPGFYIYSVFLIMFLVCSMTFCTFSVDLNKRENRLQLTFILLLTTVTFKFAVNSSLPRISYLTTLDVYILSSSIILILVCIWHAVVVPIQYFQGAALATGADLVVLGVLGTIYVIGHIAIAFWIGIRALRRNRKYEELEEKHMKRLKKQKKKERRTSHSLVRKVILGRHGKSKEATEV